MDGDRWVDTGATVTTGTRTISKTGLTSLGQFVVGVLPPPPSGVLLLLR